MKRLIILFLILLCSCKNKQEVVVRHRKMNPHKLHRYPDPTIYHKKWQN
jgi:hypothetical protein